MSVGTCSSQILYEIQGLRYLGSDVVALLEGLDMAQMENEKVCVKGVKGKTSPTTKVGIAARVGW